MKAGNASQPLHILLTGPPGIGKTTICKEVAFMLEKNGSQFDGFYTEEVRDRKGSRIGFDILRVKDPASRLPLARAKSLTGSEMDSKYQVGNYCIFLDNFEAVAFPALDSDTNVLFIDEIGKMELFSKDFKRKVTDILFSSSTKTCAIATIPQVHKALKEHAELFQTLHTDKRFKIFKVSHQNRNNLPEEIVRYFS